jgi:hypothetical protein
LRRRCTRATGPLSEMHSGSGKREAVLVYIYDRRSHTVGRIRSPTRATDVR